MCTLIHCRGGIRAQVADLQCLSLLGQFSVSFLQTESNSLTTLQFLTKTRRVIVIMRRRRMRMQYCLQAQSRARLRCPCGDYLRVADS